MVVGFRLVTLALSTPRTPHTIVQITMPLGTSFRLALALFMLVSGASLARAQAMVDPIEFTYEYPRLGGEIGLTPTWQSGVYRTGCGEFVEGTRINPLIAIAYDQPVIEKLARFELLAGWMQHSVSSRYNSRDSVVLKTEGGSVRVDVDFENQGELRTSYFFLLPSIKFNILETVYAGAGVSAGFLTGATSQYSKRILTQTVMIPELGLSEISYPEEESSDPYTKIFEEEDRPEAQAFALDMAIYVGAEFKVGERLRIGPRLLFAYPLTTIFDEPELKLLSTQVTLGARYALFR
jgi:hypothetical protein